MNKTGQTREIIQKLLDMNKTGYFTRVDIEKAIMVCRGLDPRTIQNWFNYLWKSELLIQPEQGVYHLNVAKIINLEVKIPPQIDRKQTKLGAFKNV